MKFRSGRALASGEKGSLSRHGNEPDPAPPRHRTPRHSIIDTTAGAGTRLPGTTQHRWFDVPCHALRGGASGSPGRACGTRDTPRRGVICSSSSRAHASSPSASSKTTQGTGSSPELVAAASPRRSARRGRARTARGRPAPSNSRLRIVVGLALRNRDALDALLTDVQDPASSSYGRFVTQEEFRALYAPTARGQESWIIATSLQCLMG